MFVGGSRLGWLFWTACSLEAVVNLGSRFWCSPGGWCIWNSWQPSCHLASSLNLSCLLLKLSIYCSLTWCVWVGIGMFLFCGIPPYPWLGSPIFFGVHLLDPSNQNQIEVYLLSLMQISCIWPHFMYLIEVVIAIESSSFLLLHKFFLGLYVPSKFRPYVTSWWVSCIWNGCAKSVEV